MDTKNLILIEKLCSLYKVEITFFDDLHNIGLIEIEVYEENKYLNQNKIGDIEKIIRLHHDLNVNIEGIDIVFNLLQKEKELKEEIVKLKNKLYLYEDN